MTNIQPRCDEKLSLLVAYQQTVDLYSKAVSELVKSMGVRAKLEFDEVRRTVEDARNVSVHARDRYQQHVSEHGC